MLPDLFQIHKRILQSLANCCHPPQSRTFKLLALKQTLTILDKAHIVARNGLDQGFRSVQLPEGNTEVTNMTRLVSHAIFERLSHLLCVVECIEQIAVERVDVLEARKSCNGGGESFRKGLGGVLDFSSAEKKTGQ